MTTPPLPEQIELLRDHMWAARRRPPRRGIGVKLAILRFLAKVGSAALIHAKMLAG